MKMKALNILGGVLLGGMLTSCAEWLDIEPQDKVILENFWNEKSDVDKMVAGCYSAMLDDAVIKRMMVWGEFRSENIKAGTDINADLNLEKVLNENLNAQNAYSAWGSFYGVINNCNTVIKYAPGVSEKDPNFSESNLRSTIAEVSALRDLCYFYLIRTFRDVPYTTEAYTDDDQELNLPATDFNTVLDNLIADLESVQDNAVSTYPVTEPRYQTARITKQAIWAMLCDMYLWRASVKNSVADYDKCIQYADKIIDARKLRAKSYFYYGEYQGGVESLLDGYPLNLDFFSDSPEYSNHGLAFRKIFCQGNDELEGIFELSFDKTNDNAKSNGAVDEFYGNNEQHKGRVAVPDYVGNDVSSGAYAIFDKSSKGRDSRAWTSFDSWDNPSEHAISKYKLTSMEFDFNGYPNFKHYDFNLAVKGKNKNNWIIYRLTDIMLMKAEAMTMKLAAEPTEEEARSVFSIVNVVNKRSLALTNKVLKDTIVFDNNFVNKENLENFVFQEREREFMFEGKRWYDLVRRSMRDGSTKYLIDNATQKYVSGASAIKLTLQKMDAIFWPINLDELKSNPNLKQNPAFNSGEAEGYEKAK